MKNDHTPVVLVVSTACVFFGMLTLILLYGLHTPPRYEHKEMQKWTLPFKGTVE